MWHGGQSPATVSQWCAVIQHATPASGGAYANERFVGLRLAADLRGATFRNCVFEECDLRELRLHGCELVDCDFLGCDLGLADVLSSRFGGVTFETCHVVGVAWSRADAGPLRPLEVDFKDSVLNFSSFVGLDLHKRRFEGCTIFEGLFERCDLRDASFRHSDLSGSRFRGCDMRGTDLRTARNYAIVAADNRVDGLRVSRPEASGLLEGLGVVVEPD
jgi:fluoroquinolone resistance protein